MLLEDIEDDMLEADEDMAEELIEDELVDCHIPRVPISRRVIAR